MTPKSLLRHKRRAVSTLDLSWPRIRTSIAGDRLRRERQGAIFKLVPDEEDPSRDPVSGKVYYDLLEDRERRGVDDVYLLRVEQLFPTPVKSLAPARPLQTSPEVVVVPGRPKNMGSWFFIEPSSGC